MDSPRRSQTSLMDHLWPLLAAHRAACDQSRTLGRLVALTLAQFFAFDRHTLTQLLVTLGLGDHDWSAAYRLFEVPRLDYDELSRCFVEETLAESPASEPYLVALDGVQLPRQSRTMPGTSWLHDPHSPPFRRGIHRAQRYLHLAWLTPASASGDRRALPVRFVPAFPRKAILPEDMTAQTEAEAGLAQLRWLRTTLDTAGRSAQSLIGVADSLYGTCATWRDLPERVALLTGCARNRALYALPVPRTGRGRPRRYGPRAPRPDAWLRRRHGWTTTRLRIRGRDIPCTYRVPGPYLLKGAHQRPLFLLVVKGIDRVRRGRRRQRSPHFWLVSAVGRDGQWVLPADAETLLGWAWQRWELEVTHRDLKSGFGVGESQCWQPTATVLSVQWRVWSWALAMLAGYRAWGLTAGPVRPLGRWQRPRRRWSFGQLWQRLRQECWAPGDFQRVWLRIGANLRENGIATPVWTNATLGARRI